MSRVRADRIVNRAANGAVELTEGATIPTGKTLSGAGAINISGNITTSGTLTYEDVTNVDAVGIVTCGGGLTTKKMLKEEVNIVADKISNANNIDLENGNVHLFTTNETGSTTPNLRYNASTTLDSKMSVGESIVLTIILQANSAGYLPNLTIGGGPNRTISWVGGSAPSSGSSGIDITSYTIIKTAGDTFTIIGNLTQTA